jgi:hypothetical protein
VAIGAPGSESRYPDGLNIPGARATGRVTIVVDGRDRLGQAMNVTLKAELENLIEDEVKAGRSPSSARDLGQAFTPEEIDRMIAEGLDDIERRHV